jgi:hypothetical protein
MLSSVDEVSLELRDGDRWLRIVVHRRFIPNAELEWDRGALNAVIEVDSGVFRGSFRTTLWGHEFANLRALVQALVDQLGQHLRASFALIEHGTEFEFELLRRGVMITGVDLRTDAAGVQHLAFEMEIDPSQISACIGQIDAILTRFPSAITTSYVPDRVISTP